MSANKFLSRKTINRMKVDVALAKGNLLVQQRLEEEEDAEKILEELGQYYISIAKKCNFIEEP